jgi:hypothetical protein
VASTTATPAAAPRTHRRWRTARSDLANVAARIAKTVSAVRHHNWSPALTVSGLATIDAAFYQHGWFAGLLATGLSALVYDWTRENSR